MIDISKYEVWFLTGSQYLYGEETLKKVAEHAKEIADSLSDSEIIPVKIVYKDVLTSPEAIQKVCQEANNAASCIGLITWMHTFSPAKMWISGLKTLNKPFVHLHTQYNRDIPWSEIDMDFMNLNQSAHGGREFGFICTRMGINRKVIVGHWQEDGVKEKLAVWIRAACGWQDMQNLKIARFGDNMREVAVTEGDKVEAQIQFGYSVSGYGIGDLVSRINAIGETEVDKRVKEYEDKYLVTKEAQKTGDHHHALREAARIEEGMRGFLEDGGFHAFTTTFEDLYGMKQLPGIAVQRLMAEGYGFGAEGDWKTAALVRAMKVMSAGLEGGTSFMEDYTYHLDPANMKVLGAHMLEICSSIADDKPKLEVHPLSIGGKADPPRLVFNTAPGPALNASIIDMGNRFRLIANKVHVVTPDQPMPNLPVAQVLWQPEPDLKIAAEAWILAGAAHHAGFSQSVTIEHLEDFSEIAGIEMLVIDNSTQIRQFKNELRWNGVFYANQV
jgi:L-arabinose isomerase